MLAIFSLGPWELAFIAGLLFIVIISLAFVMVGPIRKTIMRFSERNFFQVKVRSPQEIKGRIYRLPIVPFYKVLLIIVILQFINFALSIFLNNFIHSIDFTFLYALFKIFITYLPISFALFIHFQPNSNREKKYNFLIIGVACASPEINYFKLDDKNSVLILDLLINILWLAFVIIVIGMPITIWLKSLLTKEQKYPNIVIRRLYKIVQWFGILIAVIFCIPFLFVKLQQFIIPYILLRYLLTEYIQMYPIVYLRSFHYKESSEVFASLIAPEASKFGVIIGLVHEKQKGSDIFARTHIANQGQTFTVSDELWQEWVIDKLNRCSAVIIDSSVGSESVHWEIVTANKLVDPSRIIILQREGTDSEVTNGNKQLVYALNKKSLQEARKVFKKILKDIFTTSPEQIKKEKTISESVEEKNDLKQEDISESNAQNQNYSETKSTAKKVKDSPIAKKKSVRAKKKD